MYTRRYTQVVHTRHIHQEGYPGGTYLAYTPGRLWEKYTLYIHQGGYGRGTPCIYTPYVHPGRYTTLYTLCTPPVHPGYTMVHTVPSVTIACTPVYVGVLGEEPWAQAGRKTWV